MTAIHPRIRRIPATEEPLSADVFIIEGDARYYIFDVGTSDEACAAAAALDKPAWVILSHFHQDHIGNMARLSPEKVLAGARTCKYVPGAAQVDAPLVIRDGVEILVQPCVSPHAPGCLIATVDGEITLIGDLHYARPGMGQGEAKGMLNLLRRVSTRYFVPSHMAGNPLVERDELLRGIRDYYGI